MNLKVATYNIWSGRNNIETQTRNYDWTADVISEIGPDIVGLQEVGKGPCYGFPNAYNIEEDVPEYAKVVLENNFNKMEDAEGNIRSRRNISSPGHDLLVLLIQSCLPYSRERSWE